MTETNYARVLQSRTRISKVARLLKEPHLWRTFAPALRKGVFPSLEHMSISFGAEFATVIDVGASRGQFALFALARFPGARIIGFEPLPEARETAHEVLEGRHVELHGVALGSSRREMKLHVSARDDSSSLLPIGAQQVAAFPGTHETHSTVVRVDVLESYLDDTISRPCLLKIDVQGLELDVLKGAGSSLSHVDEVLVEASFTELYTGQALADDIIQYLAEYNFHLVDVHGLVRALDGTALQADWLFRRVNRPERI